MENDMGGWILAGVLVVGGLIGVAVYLDSVAAIPTPEEVEALERALPPGCVAHDVGSYGKLDNLLIVECSGREVTASYSYMHEQHGKTSEVDRAATFVIQ